MIPYETDPTLHDHEPLHPLLGDGFSPPPANEPTAAQHSMPTEATGVAPGARHS